MNVARIVFRRWVSAARAGWLGVTIEAVYGHRLPFFYLRSQVMRAPEAVGITQMCT